MWLFLSVLCVVAAQFNVTQYTHLLKKYVDGFPFVLAYRLASNTIDILLEISLSRGSSAGWIGIAFCEKDIDRNDTKAFARDCSYWIASHDVSMVVVFSDFRRRQAPGVTCCGAIFELMNSVLFENNF